MPWTALPAISYLVVLVLYWKEHLAIHEEVLRVVTEPLDFPIVRVWEYRMITELALFTMVY